MKPTNPENILKAFISILFAIGLWVIVRYYTPIQDESKLSTQIANQFQVSVNVLQSCTYLTKVYPTEVSNLPKIVSSLDIYLSRLDLPGICGLAIKGNIILFPEFWARNSQDCYDIDPSEVLAHETLHLIGLPRHNYSIFDTNPEHLAKELKDPIENVITNCFEEAYAKALARIERN